MKEEQAKTTAGQRVAEVAARIQEWQKARGWTTARMIREFPDLGSDKTFNNLANGRLEEYDAEVWVARYEAVQALIEDAAGSPADAEPRYDDLSGPRRVRRALLDLLEAQGNARVLVLEGPSGVGKTTAIDLVRTRYGKRIVAVEAAEAWGDNPGALLKSLLKRLGVAIPPSSTYECLDACVEALGKTRVCVVVDEAHHLGPRCLNTVKTLVNSTPGEFVLSAIETLWRRLEKANYEEARQLTTNRLAERVSLVLAEADVARYVERAVPGCDAKTAKAAARLVCQEAARHGNMAFVRDACRAVRRLCGDSAPDVQKFAEGCAEAARRR